MKLTKIFGIVLSLHVAVILLVMFQPGCQTFTGNQENEGEKTGGNPDGNPSEAFNSGLGTDSIEAEDSPKITGGGERFPPTRPEFGELLVPKEPSPQPELRPNDVMVYKVRKGDSLWSIATRNNITLEQLLEKNNIDKDATLSIGQEIFLPSTDPVSTSSSAPQPEKPVSTGAEIHVVRKGDTLSAIAKKLGVSVNAIMEANNLRSPDHIQIGLRLLVPRGTVTETPVLVPTEDEADPVDAAPLIPVGGQITHVVQPGETLTSIAAHYGVAMNLLADMNAITDPKKLKSGQTLIVQPALNPEDDKPDPDQEKDTPQSIGDFFDKAPEGVVVPLPPKDAKPPSEKE